MSADRAALIAQTADRVKRLARSFAAEWCRPDDPEQATEALVRTLQTAMLAFHAAARGVEERQIVAALGAAPQGSWPANDIRRVFVDGAKWWQFHAHGATAFPSEVDEMEAEATRRFGAALPAAPEPQL
jgi:hypothetical protein